MSSPLYYSDLQKQQAINYLSITSSDYDFESPCVIGVNFNNSRQTYVLSFKRNTIDRFQNVTFSLGDDGIYYFTGGNSASSTRPSNCYNSTQADFGTNNVDSYYLTNNYLYHPKIDSILVMFFIITLVCIYFPYKIFSRAFGRWLKV